MFRRGNNSIFIVIGLVVACACQSGPPSPSPRAPRQATPAASHRPDDSAVAERTRAVTANRRGAWSLTSDKVRDVSDLVSESASTQGLPADLVFGIIWVESRFNPKAVSPVGARGLMQLMPRTADYLADCIDWPNRRNAFDPAFNISAGTYYIARLIREFDGDEDLALAAYNAGPTKVRRWLKADGLPDVSIEYAAMVQTARTFFRDRASSPHIAPSREENPSRAASSVPVVTDDDLDRLGLAILIAGLGDKQFGLDREDDGTPFE
jgi:hypothetical protein